MNAMLSLQIVQITCKVFTISANVILTGLSFVIWMLNSSRNKFESLTAKITGTVDILVISGAKLDNNFTLGQFILKGGYLLKPTGNSIKAFL